MLTEKQVESLGKRLMALRERIQSDPKGDYNEEYASIKSQFKDRDEEVQVLDWLDGQEYIKDMLFNSGVFDDDGQYIPVTRRG